MSLATRSHCGHIVSKDASGGLLVSEGLEYYAFEVGGLRVDVERSVFGFGGSSADGALLE